MREGERLVPVVLLEEGLIYAPKVFEHRRKKMVALFRGKDAVTGLKGHLVGVKVLVRSGNAKYDRPCIVVSSFRRAFKAHMVVAGLYICKTSPLVQRATTPIGHLTWSVSHEVQTRVHLMSSPLPFTPKPDLFQ